MAEKCKLCKKEKSLVNSHAIPDSYFRRIASSRNGQAILITTGDEDISNTQDSMDTPQLCMECEGIINENYEKYSIALLRGQYKNFEKDSDAITFSNVDVDKFIKFCISIFYRAANSRHPSYSGAVMPTEYLAVNGNEKIRELIYSNGPIPKHLFNVKLNRLVDGKDKMDMAVLKDFMVTPFYAPYGAGKKVSVRFVLEGFLITIIMPALSDKERRSDLVMYPKGRTIIAKYKEIYSIPELQHLMRVMGQKIREGRYAV